MRAVAYADVFDYPLTAGEVHRNLIETAAPAPLVNSCLAALVAGRRLARSRDLYTLPGRESLVGTRQRRAEVAARLWPDAIRWGRALAQLPFVRMVAITGSLASDNVEREGDIDYLVVTVAGRVWVGRAMASLLRRRALLEGVRLCPNFVLSEESLLIRDQNLYTAHELLQMVPIAGHTVYRRMIELNGWTREYLPNFSPDRRGSGPESGRRWVTRVAEAALRTPLGGWLDRLERARLARKMVPRAESLAEVVYSADWCKDHGRPHGQRILTAFAERLEQAEATAS